MRTMESQRGSWRTFGVVVFLTSWLVVGVASRAQLPTGTILGTVKDATGGVIPGTSIMATNTETGSVRTVETGQDGSFRLSALPVGVYQIAAEHPGFQREVRSDLRLNIGQEAVLNFALQVGAVEQTIAVTAEAPMIETTSATVSGLVGENTMRDLPLNARSLIELGTLFAGVTVAREAGQGATAGFGTKLSILGTRYQANSFQLDGTEIKDLTGSAGSAAGVVMGVETVREFNVIASGYSAEYGSSSGGVFNAVTKSGTNNFHGSVFEYLRNDKLDARNFFDRDAANPTVRSDPPPYKRNQFGFSVGGPMVRDKTFFFGSYEALRERLGNTQVLRVPTAGLLNGLVPIPTSVTAAKCISAEIGGTVQGNNCSIPIAATIRPWLNMYPAPTPGGRDFGDGTAEFIRPVSIPTTENFFSIRGDQKFSDKDSLFGRYTRDRAEREGAPGITHVGLDRTHTQYVTVSETRLVSPEVINVLMLGYNRTVIYNFAKRLADAPARPIHSFNYNTSETCDPSGSVSGGSLTGQGGCGELTEPILNQYQLKDDVFYTRGAHSWKFGFNMQRLDQTRRRTWGFGGSFSFFDMAEYLRGLANSASAQLLGSNHVVHMQQYLYGMYAQDDFRLSPNFTLNLGLRYEFITVPYVKQNRFSNIHGYLVKPGQSLNTLVLGNPAWLNPSLKNWAPRVGFAWDLMGNGRTSIRGGAGIYYDQVFSGPWAFAFVSTPPYLQRGDFNFSTTGVRPNFPNAFTEQYQYFASNPQIEGIEYKLNQPSTVKASLDVQHSVTPSTSVEVGVSMTNAWHLGRVISINSPDGCETAVVVTNCANAVTSGQTRFLIPCAVGFNPSTGACQQGLPILHGGLGRTRPRQTDSKSSYYALRLQLIQRYARSLQYRFGYTFSKALDTQTGNVGSGDWDNDGGAGLYRGMLYQDKGRAPFDLRHAVTSNFTYDLPGSHLTGPAGKALGGWQLSGIVTLQTGAPFNVTAGATPRWWQFTAHRPDLVPGAKVKYDTRNPEGYFDPSAFTMPGMSVHPASGTAAIANPGWLGNVGRFFLDGPGIATLNLNLAKNTQVTENVRLQFRAEFFNLFNRANFQSPSAGIFTNSRVLSTTVGRITDTETKSRQVQLGMRLEF
ncbi:MAG: TonB-dependent receptor [Acidobacteria bacterium]|nr:TonB-dependent receptor [Acidobacteriota bacterium]